MRRPRLAPGFTVMVDGDSLWLVAGEDVRYRLRLADPSWLQSVLAKCDGTRTLDELSTHADARATLERLYEERVLVDGTAAQADAAARTGYRVVGDGALAARLRGGAGAMRGDAGAMRGDAGAMRGDARDRDIDVAVFEKRGRTPLHALPLHVSGSSGIDVFVQDSLDHKALLAMNREMLAAKRRWMWITTGPGGRAYVGPLFVPDAGPCAACLLVHFKRLSPVPDLYDVVLAHDGPIAATEFPEAALDAVAGLAKWKLSLVDQVAALYALHVVEVADLTVSSHAPLVDVECTECR